MVLQSSRVAFVLLGVGLTGCFYTDPINQRPSVAIRQSSDEVPHRGDFVTLTADASDPDDQVIEFSWHAYLCTDTNEPGGCDASEFMTGTKDKFAFQIPPVRLELQPAKPVESIHIVLDVEDVLGAKARPVQELTIPVANFAPELEITKVSRYGYVDGIAIDLFAAVADVDDGPTNVADLTWEVFTPAQSATYTTTITKLPQTEQAKRTEQLVLEPHGIGDWIVRVTATDRLGAKTMAEQAITIVADQDPCLSQWQPIAPLDGITARPISEPTLFQVPVVNDDLDVYPAVPSDPLLGKTTFAWSITQPGATTFTPLAITGNQVLLDPAAYPPSDVDVVELRVEIADRKATAITCDPMLLTCSTTSQPSCLQRLTWRVVMR